jgi:hypothetical protein
MCKTNGSSCSQAGECCINACDHGLCGNNSACAHDACQMGAALNAGCSPCVMSVCAQNPSCCSSTWNASCTALVATACGQSC